MSNIGSRRNGLVLAIDIIAVLVFAVLGRNTHEESLQVLGILGTAWPFWLGLTVGWGLAFMLQMVTEGQSEDGLAFDASSLLSGVVIWLSTVAIGMGIRAVTDSGTAAPFVVVALVFIGVGVLGTRLVLRAFSRVRRT